MAKHTLKILKILATSTPIILKPKTTIAKDHELVHNLRYLLGTVSQLCFNTF